MLPLSESGSSVAQWLVRGRGVIMVWPPGEGEARPSDHGGTANGRWASAIAATQGLGVSRGWPVCGRSVTRAQRAVLRSW